MILSMKLYYILFYKYKSYKLLESKTKNVTATILFRSFNPLKYWNYQQGLPSFYYASSQTTSKMHDPLPVLEGDMRNPLPWLETMAMTCLLNFWFKDQSHIDLCYHPSLHLFIILKCFPLINYLIITVV